MLLTYPDLITHGLIPNRDFFTPYGPGTFWPLSMVYLAAGGPSIMAARAVGLTYHILLALGVMAVAKPYGRVAATFAGCIAGILVAGLLLVPYGWLLALSALLWSVACADRGRFLWAGVISGFACMVRPEFLIAVLLANVPWLKSRHAGLRFAAGFFFGILPLAFHIWLVGSALFENVILQRIQVDAHLPFSQTSPGVVAALVILLLIIAAVSWSAVRNRTPRALSHAGLAIGLLPQALQRTDREHVLFVAVAVFPLFVAHVRLSKFTAAKAPMLAAAALLPWLLVVAGLAFYLVAPRGRLVSFNNRTIYVSTTAVATKLEASLAQVQSELRPGENVFVGTENMSRSVVNAGYFYYLLPSHPPHAYYLELAPGVSDRRGSRLINDVRGSDVLLLSEAPRDQRKILFRNLPPGSRSVDRYIDQHFCRIDHVPGVGSFPDVNLYRACAVTAT